MPVQETNIAWCDDSANHWVGCAKVSEGCRYCWSANLADRFDRTPEPWTVANIDANLQVYDENITDLLARRDPAWCFFPSSSDPYLPWLTDVANCPGDDCDETLWIGDGGLRCRECGWHGYPVELVPAHVEHLAAIRENDHHCFQVLTKWGAEDGALAVDIDWPENVILGVTVETQRRTYRLDWLREQAAGMKFVSFEPLLEPIEDVDLRGIDWAIVGGESGDNRRDWDARWASQLREACHAQDTAFFFKQHGDRFPEERVRLDGREWREFPETPRGVPDAPKEFMEDG